MAAPDHWGKYPVPRCPNCRQPMEKFYSVRSLRRLAVCASCFIVEEWRLAVLRTSVASRMAPAAAATPLDPSR